MMIFMKMESQIFYINRCNKKLTLRNQNQYGTSDYISKRKLCMKEEDNIIINLECKKSSFNKKNICGSLFKLRYCFY